MTREIIQKALFHHFGKVPVVNLMQADAYTAVPDTPFTEIQAHMLERNQRFVPILENSRVVGVITRTDLLRTLRDGMLKAAQIKNEKEPADSFKHGRNLRGALKSHLPAHVFALLEQAGTLADRLHVSAYVVGGFVRDLLLGRPNLDLDLVI
ncbi:MAG: poly(A) polymerase, partial [Nitrospiraceae bacterium]